MKRIYFPPLAHWATASQFIRGPGTKAHMRGAAIDVDINARVFDLTTPAGFVSPDYVYPIFVNILPHVFVSGQC